MRYTCRNAIWPTLRFESGNPNIISLCSPLCSFSEGLLCLLIFGNKAGLNHRLITFRITILNEALILCFVIIIFTTTANMCHPNTLFITIYQFVINIINPCSSQGVPLRSCINTIIILYEKRLTTAIFETIYVPYTRKAETQALYQPLSTQYTSAFR